MNLVSKITCLSVFTCSVLLIFAMGRTNTRSFEEVHQAIEGIYKDRLVVKGLIYELSTRLHEKEIALLSEDATFFERKNESVNEEIAEILREFRATYLTEFEEKTLRRFETGVQELKAIEAGIGSQKDISQSPSAKLIKSQLDSLKIDLKTLLRIQQEVGKQKLEISDKAVETISINQTIENIFMIVIGVMMVGVLLIPRSESRS